jgi:hypothetical protein
MATKQGEEEADEEADEENRAAAQKLIMTLLTTPYAHVVPHTNQSD